MVKKSIADNVEPSRAKLLILMELPAWWKSRMLNWQTEPTLNMPWIDMVLPKRPNPRRLMELPVVTKSRMEQAELKRVNERTDKLDPKCANSNIEVAELNRPKERILTPDPMCKKFNTENPLPVAEKLRTEMLRPKWA
jgi:hypothetical protein